MGGVGGLGWGTICAVGGKRRATSGGLWLFTNWMFCLGKGGCCFNFAVRRPLHAIPSFCCFLGGWCEGALAVEGLSEP